jgi:polyphosphate:AMP phosphotransferase
MFESAELGHKVDKETYDKEVPPLRSALLSAQYEVLKASKFPVIIVIGGVDGAGKGETVNLLNEWMDPRHIQTHAMGTPSDEERDRPAMWRFWRALPPKGKLGIFFGSWYTIPIVDRVYRRTKGADLDRSIEEIVRFEKMLADEGALVLKYWFHMSKDRQKKRLTSLEKDPKTRWRVTKLDWERYEMVERFRKVCEHTLRETSRAEASWTVVEGTDARYRSLTVGKALLDALQARLAEPARKPASISPPAAPLPVDKLCVLRALDFSQALTRKEYDKQLLKWQGRLNVLSREPRMKNVSVLALFEGSDAAGKGGAIRRVTSALDARQYRVIPFAAPTEEERAQPYLWRFWRHLPRLGRITLFDRSWYGRVLVERVEGFCAEASWRRAYSEINDFEEQLARHGTVVAKFWLAISNEEQLRRFEERKATEWKRYKITEEDWRNREKWGAYEAAVCEMVDRTSTEIAPWTLVEAENKAFGRIKVIRTLCERIEEAL